MEREINAAAQLPARDVQRVGIRVGNCDELLRLIAGGRVKLDAGDEQLRVGRLRKRNSSIAGRRDANRFGDISDGVRNAKMRPP